MSKAREIDDKSKSTLVVNCNRQSYDPDELKKLISSDIHHTTIVVRGITEDNLDIFIAIAEGIKINTLIAELDISWNSLGSEMLFFLAEGLRENKSIGKLILSHNSIGFSEMQVLVAILPKTSILFLNLSNNYIGAGEMQILAPILPLTSIISLDLSNNLVDKNAMTMLSKALMGTRIKYLELSGNAIEFQAIRILIDVLPKTNIMSLNLSDNMIDQTSMKLLLDVLLKTSIKLLDLSRNFIDRKIAQVVSEKFFLEWKVQIKVSDLLKTSISEEQALEWFNTQIYVDMRDTRSDSSSSVISIEFSSGTPSCVEQIGEVDDGIVAKEAWYNKICPLL